MATHLMTRRWSVSFGLLMLALVAMLLASPVAGAQGGISFSGQAFVVGVSTRLGLTTFVDTGPLPASGGTLQASLANFSDNEQGTQITAHALRALTVGEGTGSRSVASLEHLVVDDGMGNIITADVVEARAEAKCVGGQAVVASHVRITNLAINGVEQTITGQPNQVIVVSSVGSGESLLINNLFTGVGTVTVTALQFIQTDLQSILFGSVTADVSNCPPRR
jgi:hypothetical protein